MIWLFIVKTIVIAVLVALVASGFVYPVSKLAIVGFLSGALATGALSVISWVRARRLGVGHRLIRACVPVCLYMAATTSVVAVSARDDSWDTSRLTPSVAWLRGHDVYAGYADGPVESTMYPPFWVISYSPAGIGQTPAQVLQIGALLTLSFAFVPIMLAFARTSPNIHLTLLGLSCFIFLCRPITSLQQSLFAPHADAPALGLSLAACWVAFRNADRSAHWHIPAMATLAWLSVWSKQVMVPILLALPLWLLMLHGRRSALRLVIWLVVTGGLLAGLLLSLFPADDVIFNILTIPARVPWSADPYPRGLQLLATLVELLRHSLAILLFLGAGIAALWSGKTRNPVVPVRSWLRANSWVLPLLVSVVMVPVSLIGRAKVGGALNTFSPTTYFLTLACVMVWLQMPRLFDGRRPDFRVLRQTALGFLACVSLFIGGVITADAYWQALNSGRHVSRQSSQIAYEYLRTRDADAFFPVHPLAHLLADGSLYHLVAGLHDREYLASLPLSAEHRRRYLPSAPSVVCWDGSWGGAYVRANYYLEYAHAIDPPELGERWDCYVSESTKGSEEEEP